MEDWGMKSKDMSDRGAEGQRENVAKWQRVEADAAEG
jgi:hypothetical protein